MSDLFSPTPATDDQYQQFLDWQRESGNQPPLAITSSQQRDLFTMFQQFQQFEQQTQTHKKDIAQSLANDLQTLAQQRQQRQQHQNQQQTEAQRVAQHEQQWQQAQAMPAATPLDTLISTPSKATTTNSAAVHAQTWPRYSNPPTTRRRNILPVILTLAIPLLVLFIIVYFIFLSPRANLQIVSYQNYQDDSGYLHFVGLVKNVGNSAANNVVVNASVLDSKGREVSNGDDSLSGSILQPGQSVGFDIDAEKPERWSSVQISAKTEDSGLSAASGLVVRGDKLAPDGNGGQVVSGTVVNTGSGDAQAARVVFTGYDASGKVTIVGESLTDDNYGIDAGQSSSFTINLRRKDVSIVRYELFAYAYAK